jgi:hypothetical protein
MTTTSPDQIDYRPQEIDEASFVRYVLTSLGATGLGLGATLIVRRPHRAILGGAMIAAGAALLVRGLRGQWPWLRRGARPAASTASAEQTSEVDLGWSENQGEGNRIAARHYNDDVREFIDEGRVTPAARSAARAVDGPEGPALRAAEAKGKTSPTNGRH